MEGEPLTTASGGNFVRGEVNRDRADAAVTQPRQSRLRYLFVTVETSAYFLGNALALLDADSQEKEIQTFTENLRRVIKYAQQKADIGDKPS